MTAEHQRLHDDRRRLKHWKRWGPYLSERAWGTVREDYSAEGHAWQYFPHEHARSRAYRWNEDGLAGICDRHQRICFALSLWNERDPFLKERLFGLTGPEGNHGEDVKAQRARLYRVTQSRTAEPRTAVTEPSRRDPVLRCALCGERAPPSSTTMRGALPTWITQP